MNVLHVTNKPIFPILDGGCLAMHRLLLNLLDLGFNVKNISIETDKHPFYINEFPSELVQIIRPEAFYINTKVKTWDALVALFKRESYNVKRFISPGFEEVLKRNLEQNQYDIVLLESAFLLSYVNVIRKYSDAKIIVRTHNVEYRIWRQSARKEKSILKRYYFKRLANDLKRFELHHLGLVDGIFCISEQDREFFRRRSVKAQMTVIPVHMQVQDAYEVDYANNDFFFIGSMNWKPNADAVKWILDDIAPRALKLIPDVKIHIAGSNMSDSMREKKTKNVIFHGKVDNMLEFMSTHGTLLVPLKTGSGVRIKILEALCVGVPIISTEKGKEGIELLPKKHFLTANITEEFILQMKSLYNQTELKSTMGKNGKLFIDEEYSLEKVSQKVREFIGKI